MSDDSASAYEKHAGEFLSARDRSTVGAEVVKRWARSISPGTEVLEIGCGGGLPVTRVLADAGPQTLGGRLVAHPFIRVQSTVSRYSGRMRAGPGEHLLWAEVRRRYIDWTCISPQAEEQAALIHRASELIVAGGRLLFTAPLEIGTWADTTTGHECRSLGRERYESILAEGGFRVVATYEDEGQNNYYEAERVPASHAAA